MTIDKESGGPRIFFYFGRWKFFAINALFIFLAAGLFVPAALKRELNLPIFIFASSLLGSFVFLGFLYALASAAVLVDDAGISRRLFGRTCQYIRWNDVKNIREERVRNRRVSVTVIRIIGKRGRLWGFDTATTMTMSERYDRFEQLVDILNEYVANNSIPVEVKVNDIWQRELRIRYAVEERNLFL